MSFTSSIVAPVQTASLAPIQRKASNVSSRRAPLSKRTAIVTRAGMKDMTFMEWFDVMMVKDSSDLGADYETTIKTDEFKNGGRAAAKPAAKAAPKKKLGFFGKK
mmetsp:Transcript_527/g.1137  ORF Transcript_527/g.1137 Transcript_527/m.1137 type:complete len:105 (+) Transcript_527:81-395(+)|eukprot:CAMPEP_0114244030 /NCGR_PEP_ID=MMETSP0058-20121206/11115_1 /TAXON_ID=36894 /ORGANISM="Pyramimonas parkeae, CCMP726" /LENGTH=104 /DNA_ID=CAMNT_0001356929 /DNA_START=79 /DNA_END=393 /DNA_ORIENTATION=+